MAELIEEGNLSTGLWKRHYRLSNGRLFIAFSGPGASAPKPEREWGGNLFAGQRLDDALERYVEENGVLAGLGAWTSFVGLDGRFFSFREKDFNKVLDVLDSLEAAPQSETQGTP